MNAAELAPTDDHVAVGRLVACRSSALVAGSVGGDGSKLVGGCGRVRKRVQAILSWITVSEPEPWDLLPPISHMCFGQGSNVEGG